VCNVLAMTGMDLKVRRVQVRKTQQDVATILGKSRSWVAKVENMRGQVPVPAASVYDTVLRTFEHVNTEAVA